MSGSPVRRAVGLFVLVGVSAAFLGLGGKTLVPWLWVRLFPTPPAPVADPSTGPALAAVQTALDQTVVAAGGELPPRPGSGEAAVVPLPKGLSPRDLEQRLREDPRLEGADVYVTRADALLWTLRVFAGPTLILRRELRPWLPASPPHPPGNPPELAVLVDLRAHPDGADDLRWASPFGVVLEPFAPATLRLAEEAAKRSRSVVVGLRTDEPVADQLQAVPHASAALVEAPFEDGLLGPVGEALMTLVDACPRGCVDVAAAQAAKVPVLRVATTLAREDGPGVDAEHALARNLAVQWGYGLVVTPGTKEGRARAADLIEAAKDDGLPVVFVEEAGRMHGLAPLPGG